MPKFWEKTGAVYRVDSVSLVLSGSEIFIASQAELTIIREKTDDSITASHNKFLMDDIMFFLRKLEPIFILRYSKSLINSNTIHLQSDYNSICHLYSEVSKNFVHNIKVFSHDLKGQPKMRILKPHQEEIKKALSMSLQMLQKTLIRFGADDEDIQILIEAVRQLDEFFLLVVVGEFNAGKSAFINALLGESLLEEGVTPTTKKINIIRFGEQKTERLLDENQQELLLPVDWLKETSIVDTPGTNAIIRSHEEITSKFVPRSDLILFITSVDRPFTQSEQAFLEKIHQWGKKIVFVINKIDMLQSDEELTQVEKYVMQNAYELIGASPEIFPLSSRLALLAKLGNPSDWKKSRFEALEVYIQEKLDEKSRVKLKFMNPIGVGANLAKRYTNLIQERSEILKEDISMVTDIENQISVYEQDMNRDFNLWLASLENILYEMEKRGLDYFDETFRLARVFDLINKDRIAREFERNVISDFPKRIEEEVLKIIDWLVDCDLRQWQVINDYLIERRKTHQDGIMGKTGLGTFHYDRDRVLNSVGKDTQRIIETYDKKRESNSIAESAKIAVAASAAIEIGAVGLGTAVAILATTASADITGILLASVIATLGLFVIPSRKKIAKSEFQNNILELRSQLINTLKIQFSNEIEKSILRINNAMAPYTRFIRAEAKKLSDTNETLSKTTLEFLKLQDEVNRF